MPHDYVIFTEDVPLGSIGKSQLNLDEKDKEFLLNQKLIKESKGLYYSNFVGEVITPHNSYFSLPKNQFDEDLINPIKGLLLKYSKNYKHKSLVTNKGFILTKDNEFKSDKYYFDKLSSFFLDFITYEFIYPLETKKIHSIQPLPGSIDILSTNINRQIYGDGATYNVVDRKNSDDWRLDDIYYTTIIQLAREIGSKSDILEIERMFEYLNEEGYDVKEINISDKEEILKEIKKCSVNIIHNPIKNILIEYFEDQLSLKNSGYKINIFYTKNFEVVWENIIRETLFHNPDEFGQDFLDKFKDVITEQDYVPKENEKKWLRENPTIINFERDEYNPKLINYQKYDAEPDLFSSAPTKIDGLDKFKFVGDAKYYNDTKSTFHKEFSTYNDIMNNEYPMVLLVPSDKTNIRAFRFNRENKKELIILNISIYDVINDYISGSKKLIDDVHKWIAKRTRRLNNQKQNQ